jgi:hypothetical protein
MQNASVPFNNGYEFDRMCSSADTGERGSGNLQIRTDVAASQGEAVSIVSVPPAPESDAKDGDGKKHHWWREMIAGFVAVGVSCYDIWIMGKEKGLSGPLDELVLLTGIALIAGVKNLFGAKTNGKR